jgi:hypothetical protein
MELHPATRKLLQDEVARTFPKKTAEPTAPSGGWWEMLWPRFGLAGSICAVLIILAGLSGPTLFKAKSKAQRVTAFNNLKQIGLAARIYASDHDGKLPANFGQMTNELGTVKVLKDPETGKEFVYLGAGKIEGDRDSILAYSPIARGRRPVLLGDGYVQEMDEAQFKDALQRTERGTTTLALAAPPASAPALAENKPAEQEVLAKTDSKDTRLKEMVQSSKVQPGKESEQKGQLELASIDKAKQATSPPVGTATVGRESNVEIARNEAMMRERYGLLPAQAGSVASRADQANEKQRASSVAKAPLARKPQSTPETANGPQGAGGFGGATAATGAVALNGRVPPVVAQNGATTERPLNLALRDRVATDGLDLARQQRDAGKPGNSNSLAYYADASAAQSGQRYAQVQRYRVNFNSPPVPNVLRSFQVEQTGRQIRVVDADGSVY